MSDANVPLPREPDSSETRGGHSSDWEVPSPWTAKPESKSKPNSKSKPKPKSAKADQDWQTVNFPKSINVDQIPPAVADGRSSASSASPANPSEREVELLKLVGDLNQCNDNLLKRIAQLEETLEHSQAALQSEIERSQEARVAPNPIPPPAPPPNAQIAQLVSELDTTQQALQRQKIRTETLHAQLDTSQQRIEQLDRECALIRQRYTKQSQTLMETETACRDLRARLQRQQHYTLQFKAALEKSLEMPANGDLSPSTLSGDGFNTQSSEQGGAAQAISMPKAQRIQPWSADTALKQAPNLDVLINGLSAANTADASAALSSIQSVQTPVGAPQSTGKALPPGQSVENKSGSDTGAIPWLDVEKLLGGAKIRLHGAEPSEQQNSNPSAPSEQALNAPSGESPEGQSGASGFKLPFKSPLKLNSAAAPPSAPAEGDPQLTEPSPWGAAIKAVQASLSPSSPTPESSASESAGDQAPLAADQSPSSFPPLPPSSSKLSASLPIMANQSVETPPALNPDAVGNSPSPIVYPLRPQKKIKSLAAVELPNFPRNQQR